MTSEAATRAKTLRQYSTVLKKFVEEAPLERMSILQFVAATAVSLPEGSRVADVGAGSAPFRELFDHVDYLTVDRAESPHGDASDFDLVASAEALPFLDESLDAILCTQVLEHLPEPAQALAEFYRVLKPGRHLFLTAPLVWEEHEKPYDFFRYTRSGLDHLLTRAGFEQVEVTGRTDCFTTLAQLLSNARWSLGEVDDESVAARRVAFQRLGQISEELLKLAPLDARHAFPLGFQVVATRPRSSAGSQALDQTPHPAKRRQKQRTPVLYLAPWVDLGGSDKGTIDWFKHIDHERWAPSIITTQPSANRWLPEVEPHAEEVWSLPDLMPGADFPSFILGFIESRGVEVVHIMNSRLAFDLLPDMRCLPDPPSVVVQLHAEEHDRSGYVRYVASRYGNLVDAFSVTSQQLANAMLDYDVARSRIHVIPTGVDALGEFNPDHVVPFDLEDESNLRILWPGRLVPQKDPMLTLEVVKLLQTRGVPFTLHIVGDGDMKDDVVRRAREMRIDHMIRWHPPSHEMPRWYRSSDLLLMTSTFEGVPYVMYEALAMGVPVVVPALPGNVELLGPGGGALIDPRDDVNAYADAIQDLLNDKRHRREVGDEARTRMLKAYSLPDMGRRHNELYEQLLDHRPTTSPGRADEDLVRTPEPLALPTSVSFSRDPPPDRSVAVIVPCYQHGRFLPEAIQSLREQTLRPRRIVVVDDASEDTETSTVLDELDQDPLVTVIRMTTNSGPSVARNKALAEITENYVLPLDADDKLPACALEDMVAQIERAPSSVGFIYPRIQHFGNRHDFYEPPAYNLNTLLANNYCAAASLFDRRVFDTGIRYAEDIMFGHEDWDLVLQMAEHDIQGEVAESATLWYRKRGFSRVNAAEYGPESFHKHIERRHPLLYRQRREQIKAAWGPALSIILADGCDGVTQSWPDGMERDLREQACSDFEIICAGPTLKDVGEGLQICDVDGVGLERIERSVEAARGRFVLLAGVSATSTLRQHMFVEQLIRIFWSNVQLKHFVLANAPDCRGPRLGLLTAQHASNATPCAVAWRRGETTSEQVELGVAATPLEDVIMHWQVDDQMGWRAA